MRKVRVKIDHNCELCGNVIIAGSVCITIKPDDVSRKWICLSCYQDLLNNDEDNELIKE